MWICTRSCRIILFFDSYYTCLPPLSATMMILSMHLLDFVCLWKYFVSDFNTVLQSLFCFLRVGCLTLESNNIKFPLITIILNKISISGQNVGFSHRFILQITPITSHLKARYILDKICVVVWGLIHVHWTTREILFRD